MPYSQYREVYNQRKAAAADKTGKAPKDNNSITIESPGVIDLSEGKFPKVPPKANQPVLPVDDSFKKLRTQQA